MRKVHACQSCGFVSTMGSEFVRFLGVKVCAECKTEYGSDPDVTRWIDEKRPGEGKVEANGAEAQMVEGG